MCALEIIRATTEDLPWLRVQLVPGTYSGEGQFAKSAYNEDPLYGSLGVWNYGNIGLWDYGIAPYPCCLELHQKHNCIS